MSEIVFVQFTDTHVQPEHATPLMGFDTFAKLQAAVAMVRKLGVKPHFYVITGDLTHETAEDGYQRLKLIVDNLTADGTPVMLSLGNHDVRIPFRKVFFNQDADEATPYYFSQMIDGLRVVVLDTKMVGTHDGSLDDAQLAWLKEQLAQPADLGNLIVMHHPPSPNAFVPLASHLLKNQDDFAAAIQGQHVVGVLSGHVHFHSLTHIHGIPSMSTAGVAFTLDPYAQGGMRMLDGSGFVIGHVRDGQLLLTPITMPGEQAERVFMGFEQLRAASQAQH